MDCLVAQVSDSQASAVPNFLILLDGLAINELAIVTVERKIFTRSVLNGLSVSNLVSQIYTSFVYASNSDTVHDPNYSSNR